MRTSLCLSLDYSFRPELEVQLREHCHKVRVTEKLSGAHLVFPSESSLAVRAYYPADLDALRAKIAADVEGDQDVGGLAPFSTKFRNAMVVVVLPEDRTTEEDSESSVLQHMQHLLETADPSSDNPSTRFVVVRSTEQAIEALTAVADSLRPSGTSLKVQYLKRQEKELDPFNSTGPALGAWLQTDHGIEQADKELVLSHVSNVDSLIGNDMDGIPCDTRVKHLLRRLFVLMPESADVASVTPSSIAPDASPAVLEDPVVPTTTFISGQNHYAVDPFQSFAAPTDHRHQSMAAFPATAHNMICFQQTQIPSAYVVRAPSSHQLASALLVHSGSSVAYGAPQASSSSRHCEVVVGGGRYVGLDPPHGGRTVVHRTVARTTQGSAAAASMPLPATVHPRGGVVVVGGADGDGAGTLATPRRGYNHFAQAYAAGPWRG
jgi:hypothetical protein